MRVRLRNAGAENPGDIMAIIGLVLLAAAAVFGIELAAMNDYSIEIDAFNQVYSTTASIVFVAGIVTGLATALGLMLLRDGLVRRRRVRLEAREAEEHRQRHIAALEEEHATYHGGDGDGRDREHVDLRDRVRDSEPDHDRVTTF
jgi:hypothetical protein